MRMKILIPTYKREEMQKCYYEMPESIRKKIIVCTHSGRGKLLQEKNPGMTVHEFEGELQIPKVRQACLEFDEKVLVIDDQCIFWKRNYVEGKIKHVRLSQPEEYEQMFEEIERELDDYFWVGPSPKSSNTLHKEQRSEITRSYSCYGLNRSMFREADVRFTGLEEINPTATILEDFYALLAMFTKGYKNLVLHDWVFDHKHGATGGNSVHRRNANQDESQKELIKLFPQFVKQYEKENPSWVAEEGSSTRTEVRVAWKKSFKQKVTSDLEEFFG